MLTSGMRSSPRPRAAWAALAGVLALVLAVSAAYPQPADKPPGGAPPLIAPAAPPPSNAVTLAAVQQGVLNCAGRINQVSGFVGYTQQAGALLMAPPAQPDLRLIPLVMEIATESGTVYVSASFAPNQANGCGASYDAVAYWPLKCEAVAARQFGGFKKVGLLRKDISVLDGGLATKVFLMAAGSGCVSIKKEVVL